MKRNYKKLLIAGLTASFMVALVGCGGKPTTTDDVSMTTEEVTTTEKATTEDITTVENITTEVTTEKVAEEKTTSKKNTSTKKDTAKKTTTSEKKASTTNNTSVANNTSTTNNNTSTSTVSNNTSSNNTTVNNTPKPSTTENKPQTTECQHNWVHHDAVTGERGVKPAVIATWYCNNCQKYMISVNDDPCNGANGSDAYYILEPAVWETYEVSPAYDECSKCGIRR